MGANPPNLEPLGPNPTKVVQGGPEHTPELGPGRGIGRSPLRTTLYAVSNKLRVGDRAYRRHRDSQQLH
eukprot:451672-Pyramimonas_sp.AAC.1